MWCPPRSIPRTKDIPRQSIQAWKANLSFINHRYNDSERRLLELFAEHPQDDLVMLDASMTFHLKHLIDDGFIVVGASSMTMGYPDGTSIPMGPQAFVLTAEGREFVTRWAAGLAI